MKRLMLVLAVTSAMIVTTAPSSTAGIFRRGKSRPVRQTKPRNSHMRYDAYRGNPRHYGENYGIYSKYYYGFHSRYFQEIGRPGGERSMRGEAW